MGGDLRSGVQHRVRTTHDARHQSPLWPPEHPARLLVGQRGQARRSSGAHEADGMGLACRGDRSGPPLQSALVAELLARFHGTARRSWYLSDGGHFENTAGYELIRRRLPLIIVCDCGRDPDGSCEDLAGLVRKARVDLNAEIRFFDESELEALPNRLGTLSDGCRLIGRQSEFRRLQSGELAAKFSKCHASIAWVTYSDEPQRRSVLLVLKPTLTGEEPLDLIQLCGRGSPVPPAIDCRPVLR